MTKLTADARTILRARVRGALAATHPAHVASLGIALPEQGVPGLPVADLIQAAQLLGLGIPTDRECAAYRAAREAGKPMIDALAAAAHAAPNGIGRGNGGHVPHGISSAQDEAEEEAQEEAQEDARAEAAAREPQPQGEADPVEAEASALVASLRSTLSDGLARGDLSGYIAALSDVARRAVTPPPAPVVIREPAPAMVDPSKIIGTVPQVIGRKTMAQAGVIAPATALDAATALDVYDAPDAPRASDGYVWPELTGAALSTLARGRHVMLYGPAGTGKTEFARQIAARWGRPFVRISCDDQTEAATLLGMTGLDGKGGMAWRDGQLLQAIRRPGTVVLVDEPSVARPGALFVLQALMDDARAVSVAETGEVVPMAPGVLIILADNTNGTGDPTGQYEATRRLNRATLDRVSVTLEIGYLPPDVEARTIAARTGLDETRALVLAKWAALTRSNSDRGLLSHGVGLRRLIALGELIADGVNPVAAMQVAVLEGAPYDDREPLRQLWAAEVPAGALDNPGKASRAQAARDVTKL